MPALPNLHDFKSALIIKPSSLGDIVHTLPAVKALRQAHPHLRLRWLANTEWTPLIQGSPLIDEVLPFPRKQFRGLAGLLRFWDWRRQWMMLPREEPEIVLDFQGLLRSGIVSRWRGSKTIIGLSDAREGARHFYSQIVPVDAAAHAVDRYLEMPRAFGIRIEPQDITFDLAEGSRPTTADLDWSNSVAVHPWSRGEGKSLSDEALDALCDALAPRTVILVGMHGGAHVPQGLHIRDLSNQTSLAELVWIMRHAGSVISVDSGPMHIAAAVNPRTLGLHTWSDPRKVGPYPASAEVWKAGRIAKRGQFTTAECATDAAITPEAARLIAAWAKA
ncbi:MAG: glycosyltransferase family 9 protein [Verrucomicrobiaceae bacterium]|nr:glycosyltransferase family 9 protein [Verrucomicrobiaceae bacterium]